MKILHILYSGLGGHGSVFFSLVEADRAREFDYHALFNGVEDIRDEYVQRCLSNNIPYDFVKKKPGKHLRFYYQIYKCIRKARPDIVFLHGSMSVAAAFIAKLGIGKNFKIVIRETQAMHLKSRPEQLAFKAGMKLADRIIFLSREYAAEIEKSLGRSFKKDKIAVIPNGIDLSLFRPVPVKASNKVGLGMQSRLVSIKDHLTLFKALNILRNRKDLPDFHLYIAGDGSYRYTLEDAVNKAGLNEKVTFTGMLNEAELPSFLQSLDIYIHASLGETMSTAIMQSMACGLPIIASDVQGINNMISDIHNGLLVPAKDEDAMANAIIRLVSDDVLKRKLSENALAYATTHFSNKRMFEEYKKIFNSFASNGHS